MKTYIPKILGKPSDYWVCDKCKGLNWYENEVCSGENQGLECDGLQPNPTNSLEQEQEELKVIKFAQDEIDFLKMEYCEMICSCKEGECKMNNNEFDVIQIFI